MDALRSRLEIIRAFVVAPEEPVKRDFALQCIAECLAIAEAIMPPRPPMWHPSPGCICPPGSELSCKGLSCPRRSVA